MFANKLAISTDCSLNSNVSFSFSFISPFSTPTQGFYLLQ